VKFRMLWVLLLSPLLVGTLPGQEKVDSSKHAVQMVQVEKDVSLEVLDWGGTGRPLVLLTGLADNAHIFDEFAPKLTARYHVYGVTRRGRGVSSKPEPIEVNYTADRLGEDVLAVIDALHLVKPVIAGHSLAGEELSYIGSHRPENVAGLIYIEAGYPYALYDQLHGELELDAIELRKQLRPLINGYAFETVKDYNGLIDNLHRIEKEIQQHQQDTKDLPPSPVSPRMTPDLFAIMEGRERFITIQAPALVILATDPSPIPGDDPQSRAAAARQRLLMRGKELQIEAFKRQVPSARIVLIPHATHYVFQSNEAEVLREMDTFIATLPPEK
jgi:non-heme chloroperoxidase